MPCSTCAVDLVRPPSGPSEAGAETVRRTQAVHPLSDLQIEYSLLSRGIEAEILPTCRELRVGATAYGVLSRGLLGGRWPAGRELAPNDFRMTTPRFSADNIGTKLALVEALRAVARARGATVAQATVAQVAVAWVAAQGDDIVSLIGAKRPDRLAEAVAALGIRLGRDDLADIERAMPPDAVAGQRYDVHGMAALDSERN